MIDEDRTMQLYGYTSNELAPKSNKKIVAVCEECGAYRVISMQGYRALCHGCAQKKRWENPANREKASATHKTPEARQKQSVAMKKHWDDPEAWQKHSVAQKKRWEDPEERKRLSAARQHVSIEDWEGFAKEQKYCPKFNEELREKVREKYGRTCWLCGKTEAENGRRLSVHHIDMNKNQGCGDDDDDEGIRWRLIPLCASCHGGAHTDSMAPRLSYMYLEEQLAEIYAD